MGSKQGFRAVTFAVVIAAGAFGLVTSAGAQGWHHGGGNDVMAIMHRLDLTAQQKTQIHALMEADRQATESTRQQLRTVSGQIETAMFSAGSVSSLEAAVTPDRNPPWPGLRRKNRRFRVAAASATTSRDRTAARAIPARPV